MVFKHLRGKDFAGRLALKDLCLSPSGDLFATGKIGPAQEFGNLLRIESSGRMSRLGRGFNSSDGLTYDRATNRLIFSANDGTVCNRSHAAPDGIFSLDFDGNASEITRERITGSRVPLAIDREEPFAQAMGLSVSVMADLRERKLAEGRWDDWLALLRQAWSNFDFALPHCESSYDCQRRMCHCLAQLVANHRCQTLVVSSHGNAIALYLNSIESAFGFEAWAAMKNPDVFRITYDAGRPFWHKSFNLSGFTE